ncbi:helix-turn-helix domain-containing protein [Thiomicrospira microaerophila]|jgi:transcriptional regulator with XRE-family HTH domain|uniref:helix-turn-helix domain-containing protein n=1 Tax=Thiomicrospira microaerophila TaxID=406020 RepID=UPI0005CB6F14|nr:helix-turn-helix transcriptional regulator [Thiomicrospira microaerophila]
MKKSVWQENYKIISAELKAMRIEAGLSQVSLSERLERPQSYVSKYENGDRYLDFIEVLAICSVCGTSPSQLIKKLGFDFKDL